MESSDKTILLPYQQRWVNDRSPLKIWLASRQVGKSFALAMEAVTEALKNRCNNLILSSSERQSKEVMHKVYDHLRFLRVRSVDIIKAERESREEVLLPNGSRIISLPANPDTVRGFSGNVYLDEFAFHSDSEEIWRAMYPTVTRGYGIRVASTPNGMQNMFYKLWNTNPPSSPFAKGGEKEGDTEDNPILSPSLEKRGGGRFNVWSRHRTDIYDAASEGLSVDIGLLKDGIGDPEGWAQEFECQFMDEATAYITYEMIASCEDDGATKEFTPTPVLPPQGGGDSFNIPSLEGRDRGRVDGDFYLGVDIGRKRDLTVFWMLEKIGDVFWTRMVREMSGELFRVQKEFLFSLMGAVGAIHELPLRESPLRGAVIRRVCIDSSGIGAQLAEEAAEAFGRRVEGVIFTQAVKEELAVTLRRKFEERTIRIPQRREIRDDIHSVRRSTTASGNLRFDAARSEGSHADRFWALALAVHAAGGETAELSYERLSSRRFIHAGCI